jgi:peptidoglycan/xylan/chitin deacetylase (PgdA/CDA1 family)
MNAKKRIKSLMGRAADACGLLVRDFSSKMVIVTFHRVNDQMEPDGITCTAATFEAFCRFFQAHFRIVPLAEQIAGCRSGRNTAGTLSITFDDGYRDNAEIAAPILRSLDLPATFFVVTGFIGTDYTAPWDAHLARPPQWMDWNHLRALRDQQFEIGAHTDRHIDLGAADPAAIRADLARCRAKLQEELAAPVRLFAYPFGGRRHIQPGSVELVREAGFECCLSSCGGVNAPVADPFQLNRINVGGWFETPHQFGMEIMLRRA